MHLSILPASLLLSLVAAQTTLSSTTSSTACAAQPVMDACYASTSAIAQACSTTDYGCLCSKWNDVLTCFLQCPNDPRFAATYSSHATYCNDASVYGSSTATSAISAPVSAGTTPGAAGAKTTDSSGGKSASSTTGSGSGTGTASVPTSTNTKTSGAEGLVAGAGSVLVGVAGIVGALL